MARSKLVKVSETIAESVTGGLQTIQDTVVGGYTKIEDAFVAQYLTHEGESVAEAKARLRQERAERTSGKTGQ